MSEHPEKSKRCCAPTYQKFGGTDTCYRRATRRHGSKGYCSQHIKRVYKLLGVKLGGRYKEVVSHY